MNTGNTLRVIVLAGATAVLGAGLLENGIATPVVTGSAARAFLGGKTGKLIYTKFEGNNGLKNGRTLWYVDFDDETLVERLVVTHQNTEPRNPIVSPDGKWVIYNTWTTGSNSQLYICPFSANVTAPVSLGEGAQPSWWVKPGTTTGYVIYPKCDIEECWHCNFPSSTNDRCDGTRYNNWGTYIRKIVNGQPSGSETELIPYYSNGGRSPGGKYLFASSRGTGIFTLGATDTANDGSNQTPFDQNNWGCNPSISSHPNDADVKLVWLNEPHDGLYVGKTDGTMLKTIAAASGDSNQYWDTPQYSTDTDFVATVASRVYVQPPFDIYLVRISDGSSLKIVQGNYEFPYLWVKPPQIRATTPDGQSLPSGRAALRYAEGRIRLAGRIDGPAVVRLYDAQGCVLFRGPATSLEESRISLARRGPLFYDLTDRSGRVSAARIGE